MERELSRALRDERFGPAGRLQKAPRPKNPSVPSHSSRYSRSRLSISSIPTSIASASVAASPPASIRSIPTHPFANTTSKLEVLPSDSDKIDIEAEARLYEDLCHYEDDSLSLNAVIVRSSKGKNKRTSQILKSIEHPAAESIFSADIFLADNTGHTSTLAFARDVKITGWTTVGDRAGKKGGIGAYVVYDCTILTKEGTTMHILKRYSAFEELYEELRMTLPRQLQPSVPALPPKAPLARFRPAFLDSRRKKLEYWLSNVLLHPDVGGRQVVRAWVLK